MAGWIEDRDAGVVIAVRVKPRSKKDDLEGVDASGRLVVRLAAPPVDDKANRALIALLAKRLGVPRSAVTILAGEKSRTKTLAVAGLDAKAAAKLLLTTKI